MKKYIFLVGLFGLLLSSCIKDDSTYGDDNVSQLSLQTPLEKTYTLNQGEVLNLSPTVVQTNAQLPVSYEWEVNHQKVSTQPNLSYTCTKSGIYPCRLKITNGQNMQLYEFSLNVEFAYTQGLFVLAEKDNHAILTYVPSDASRKHFELDVLAPNNSGITFGAPCSMAWNKNLGNQDNNILVLAAGNPSTIYQLDGYEMVSTFKTNAPGRVSQIVRSSNTSEYLSMLIIDGGLYSLAVRSTNLVPKTGDFSAVLGYAPTFADAMAPWWRNDLFYAHADAYFDNSRGALLAYGIESQAVPKEIVHGTFTDETLVGMGGVDKQRNLAVVTRHTTTGKYYLTHLFPGYYSADASRRIAPNVFYHAEIPATTGITTSSIVRTARSKNLVYFTAGNKIYAHNVLAGTSISTTPLFTVGNATETIVDMVFSDDDDKLYVATNSTTGTLSGNLYCYDLQANTLLWQKPNVTGKIVKMLYRN